MRQETFESERVFRTAAWMWLAYLIAMGIVDLFIYANQPASPLLLYYLANALPAILFLGLTFSGWLRNQATISSLLKIALITTAPILVNYVTNIHLPPAPLSNIEGMILRQLPVLFLGLVLVAWHYNLMTVIFYSLGTNLLEVGLVFGFTLLNEPRLSALYFIVVIRTVCLIVVGIFINRLITRLRTQQESLRTAHLQLSHYASTLEDLTVSRERNRMSRELHDTVVHTLSGLAVQLETAQAYLDIQPETARLLLDQSLEATRSGLQETRRSLKALRASPLEDLGLVKAIQMLAETAAQRGRFALEVSLPEQDPILSPDVDQCLYRIAQEAVENIVRHTNAQNVVLRLSRIADGIELFIQDDGVGFDLNRGHFPGHFGLQGMKERAKLSGGELTIASKPGSGTKIRLVIQGVDR
jgi:signal transduction histidine kinase